MLPKLSWKEWVPHYEKIVTALGIDRKLDEVARNKIAQLSLQTKHPTLEQIKTELTGKKVVVFGAGPSLDVDIEQMIEKIPNRAKLVKIAADGATSGLLNHRVLPNVIVTDLDGDWTDLLAASRLGSMLIVHAHGDNLEILDRVTSFKQFLPTTQVEEIDGVMNFGGFTDGDRAAFFASAFAPEMVALAGMDLGSEIGRYSQIHKKSIQRKRIKLRICKELLEWLSQRDRGQAFGNLTAQGEEIRGFPRKKWEQLM
jgi:uncharacterized Rossmann fold enzyme